jgi:hypothetical protein
MDHEGTKCLYAVRISTFYPLALKSNAVLHGISPEAHSEGIPPAQCMTVKLPEAIACPSMILMQW